MPKRLLEGEGLQGRGTLPHPVSIMAAEGGLDPRQAAAGILTGASMQLRNVPHLSIPSLGGAGGYPPRWGRRRERP